MIKAEFELWKDIEGFEGLYQVSTWGNVRSLDRWVADKNGIKHFYKGKILKPTHNKQGYFIASLYKNGEQFYFQVHRLVAITFIPNPKNKPQVNHKDEVKSNNYRTNLEWMTSKENHNYGTRNRRAGESNKNGKRSKKVYQYNLQGDLINIWASTRELERNGYDRRTILKCCKGKGKTYKNSVWSESEIINFDVNNYKNKSAPKKVYQYDLQGNLIKEWSSASEAGRNGFNSGGISLCCSGIYKTHKGCIWKFKESN